MQNKSAVKHHCMVENRKKNSRTKQM